MVPGRAGAGNLYPAESRPAQECLQALIFGKDGAIRFSGAVAMTPDARRALQGQIVAEVEFEDESGMGGTLLGGKFDPNTGEISGLELPAFLSSLAGFRPTRSRLLLSRDQVPVAKGAWTSIQAPDPPRSKRRYKRIRGTNGADRLIGTGRSDKITGRKGRDLLKGRPSADRLSGGKGRDRLLAGPGDDFLSGGLGRDVIRCGPGYDVVEADRRDRTRGCEVKLER